MLIEMHTLRRWYTPVLPAVFSYAGSLASGAAQAKSAGIKEVPQVERANEVGRLARQLTARRTAMSRVIDRAEAMHDAPTKAAMLLTHGGADTMGDVRTACDALELIVADELWPLPKYREMLFPV